MELQGLSLAEMVCVTVAEKNVVRRAQSVFLKQESVG